MTPQRQDVYQLMFRDYPDIVTVSQLSKMLCISEKSAYQLVKDGTIEHFKIGRTYRIPKLNIFDYLRISA